MIPSEFNFDEIMKANIEQLFPVEVIIDRENNRGLFKFTSAFPPFEGTVVHFKSAYFNEALSDLSIQYEVIENPKTLNPQDKNVQIIVFKIVSFIFQLENKLLLNQK